MNMTEQLLRGSFVLKSRGYPPRNQMEKESLVTITSSKRLSIRLNDQWGKNDDYEMFLLLEKKTDQSAVDIYPFSYCVYVCGMCQGMSM